MKQNKTLKPAPLHLARTQGQAKVEEVLSGFWLYVIREMGNTLDATLWAQQQLHSAACELSLSADIATLGSGLGSGLAEPQKVQAFVETAMAPKKMPPEPQVLAGPRPALHYRSAGFVVSGSGAAQTVATSSIVTGRKDSRQPHGKATQVLERCGAPGGQTRPR